MTDKNKVKGRQGIKCSGMIHALAWSILSITTGCALPTSLYVDSPLPKPDYKVKSDAAWKCDESTEEITQEAKEKLLLQAKFENKVFQERHKDFFSQESPDRVYPRVGEPIAYPSPALQQQQAIRGSHQMAPIQGENASQVTQVGAVYADPPPPIDYEISEKPLPYSKGITITGVIEDAQSQNIAIIKIDEKTHYAKTGKKISITFENQEYEFLVHKVTQSAILVQDSQEEFATWIR
jgi:hypothetical protein